MKIGKECSITVKDEPLFFAIGKACLVNTVTNFKNDTSVTELLTREVSNLSTISAPLKTGGTGQGRGCADRTCMTRIGGGQLGVIDTHMKRNFKSLSCLMG